MQDIEIYKKIRDIADEIVRMSMQIHTLEHQRQKGIKPLAIDVELPDSEGKIIRLAIPLDEIQADLIINVTEPIIKILKAKVKELVKELKEIQNE